MFATALSLGCAAGGFVPALVWADSYALVLALMMSSMTMKLMIRGIGGL